MPGKSELQERESRSSRCLFCEAFLEHVEHLPTVAHPTHLPQGAFLGSNLGFSLLEPLRHSTQKRHTTSSDQTGEDRHLFLAEDVSFLGILCFPVRHGLESFPSLVDRHLSTEVQVGMHLHFPHKKLHSTLTEILLPADVVVATLRPQKGKVLQFYLLLLDVHFLPKVQG